MSPADTNTALLTSSSMAFNTNDVIFSIDSIIYYIKYSISVAILVALKLFPQNETSTYGTDAQSKFLILLLWHFYSTGTDTHKLENILEKRNDVGVRWVKVLKVP